MLPSSRTLGQCPELTAYVIQGHVFIGGTEQTVELLAGDRIAVEYDNADTTTGMVSLHVWHERAAIRTRIATAMLDDRNEVSQRASAIEALAAIALATVPSVVPPPIGVERPTPFEIPQGLPPAPLRGPSQDEAFAQRRHEIVDVVRKALVRGGLDAASTATLVDAIATATAPQLVVSALEHAGKQTLDVRAVRHQLARAADEIGLWECGGVSGDALARALRPPEAEVRDGCEIVAGLVRAALGDVAAPLEAVRDREALVAAVIGIVTAVTPDRAALRSIASELWRANVLLGEPTVSRLEAALGSDR